MAAAYECDRCKLTFMGEARQVHDLLVPGTRFTLRVSFGMARASDELEEIREQADRLKENPLAALFGAHVDEDRVENVAADLCDPCRAVLLREAVELAGLDLHEVGDAG